MNKKYIGIAVVIAIGVAILWQIGVFEKKEGDSVIATQTPFAEPSNSFLPLPTGRLEGFWGPSGLREPASCELSGSIEFVQKNIFASDKALFVYQNIDDDGRNVRWVISPSDDLRVGPNLFSGLDLPSGQSSVTVALPESPKARSYTLTAFVGYGQVIENGGTRTIVVKEARCKGSIPVKLSY